MITFGEVALRKERILQHGGHGQERTRMPETEKSKKPAAQAPIPLNLSLLEYIPKGWPGPD